ncbi:MAG: Bro-N domain-containing protein [Patescibacteria group bacterium]|jgi:DNA-damage-inducible protein D|nr:Bro-N domain-containing protein [Patescibacteria group bacterium]
MPKPAQLPLPEEGESKIDVFRKQDVRKIIHKKEWWFSVKDVLEALTDATDGTEYAADLRKSDSNLDTAYTEIVKELPFYSKGENINLEFTSIEGLFRLMQSVPTEKAEHFKKWLAKVGFERLQEINNPDLAIKRAMTIYRSKGYSDEWIDARIRNKASRELITKEWSKRGVASHISLLTDAISEGTFGIKTAKHKEIKGLAKQSLRDNMTPIELTLTTLGEQATKEITQSIKPTGLQQNMTVAQQGGRIAGAARINIENATNKKVVSSTNYLTDQQRINNSKESAEFDKAMKKYIKINTKNSNPQNGAKLGLSSGEIVENKNFSGPLKIIVNESFNEKASSDFKNIIQDYVGDDKVFFKVTKDGDPSIFETGHKVDNCSSLHNELKKKLGDLITIIL